MAADIVEAGSGLDDMKVAGRIAAAEGIVEIGRNHSFVEVPESHYSRVNQVSMELEDAKY